MMGADVEQRLERLEHLAGLQNEALRSQCDLLLASSVMLTAVLALIDAGARETVRHASLTALGDDPAHAGARALVEKLTVDPRQAFLAAHEACGTVIAGPERSQ